MHIETIRVKIAENPHFTANCYLVSSSPESNCALAIDPGDEPALILQRLGERKLAGIVITHGHYDHIGGVAKLVEETGASTYVHKDDSFLIEHGYDAIAGGYRKFQEKQHHKEEGFQEPLTNSDAPKIDFTLADGDTLELCNCFFKVIHTPGHSPGSICLYNEDEGVLFSGDTLFRGTCGRTDFMGGSPEDMHRSLARLARLSPNTLVFPGHNETTTIGKEQHRGLSEY